MRNSKWQQDPEILHFSPKLKNDNTATMLYDLHTATRQIETLRALLTFGVLEMYQHI
jgi:hypothetical protein